MSQTSSRYKKYSIFIIVFVFLLQYINVGLLVDGMNVLFPALEAKFGWTREQITSATSASVYITIIAAIVFGTLMMRTSIKTILVACIALMGVDVILLANTTNFELFTLYMVTMQVLTIGLMQGSFAIITNWFNAKRGMTLGIVTIGAPACSATFVMIGTQISIYHGHEYFYTSIGGYLLALALIGALFIKNRPEEIGCGIDGNPIDEAELARDAAMNGGKASKWSFMMMMANKEMWLLSISWGLIFMMMTGMMYSAIPRFTDVGFPIETALWFFSSAALLGMPLSYFWGCLDDKLGTPKACVIFGFSYILASLSMLFGSADNMFFTLTGVLAIALTTGGMPNLQPSLQAWVYGRKEFVATSRYTNVIHNIFRSSAFAYMSFIFTTYGSYDMAYLSFIGLSIIVIVCFAAIKKSYDPENELSENFDPDQVARKSPLLTKQYQ